jgi:hypothetical protein
MGPQLKTPPTCTTSSVSAAYTAAMMPACAMYLVLLTHAPLGRRANRERPLRCREFYHSGADARLSRG